MILLPHVQPEMLLADYWLDRIAQPDAPLLTQSDAGAFNARVHATLGIPPVFSLPDALPADEVRCHLYSVPDNARYDVDGSLIPERTWKAIRTNVAADAITDPAPIRWALTTRYAPLRTLPTDLTALKTPDDLPFDRLQETTLDIGWPVAVLHTSADGAWCFGLTPGYWGWVRTRHVAFTDKQTARDFVNAESTLMVQGSWGDIALPGEAHHRPVKMATRLPLQDARNGLYKVLVPRANDRGQLHLVDGYVARKDDDWVEGMLPITLRTVFTQVFKVLGEPYAWGGMRLSRPGRDCSRLVWDTWASVGVYLPRNSDQQGAVGVTSAYFAPDEPNESRLARLAKDVSPGALVFLDGHVMLYLGMVKGVPYAIHDLWNYAHPEGHTTRAGQVVVSALPPEPSATRHTLLERLTHVKAIAPF